MKLLITGGAGFIGSQLGYYLNKQGHEVLLLDDLSFGNKDNLEINGKNFGSFTLDDIRTSHFQQYLKGVDVVFHFAAIAPLPVSQVDPYRGYSVNVAGWANVLEACRREKTPKVILASTSAIYENNTTYPFQESDETNPHMIYCMSKKHAEDLAHSFTKLYNMDITILRFFNVYGPHHDFRRKSPPLIAYIIKCMMTGQTPILHSDGKQERDYIYIDDVCRMCKIAMENPASRGDTFNVASNTVVSMNQIYDEIAKLFNSNVKPIFRDPKLLWDKYLELELGHAMDLDFIAKETNKYSIGSYEKSEKILGWKPTISFQEGIKETVEYAVKTGL
jgi:nucleoside-diphosphate-sugar epimerase